MSLYSDLVEVLTPYANKIKGLAANLGNLSNLETTDKSSIVAAINEAARSGGTEIIIDNTLTQSGQAADAKAAGNAISQLSADLANNVNDLKSVIANVTGYEAISFTNGKYIRTNLNVGDLVDLTPITGYNTNNYAIVDVQEGDRITINATGGIAGRLWCFIDSTNHLISVSASKTTVSDFVLVAPEYASKLILNPVTGYGNIFMGENLNKAIDDISGIQANLGDLGDLETTDKSSIVAAINEVAQSGGGGVPASVKSAMLAIFQAGTYTSDVSSHIAVVSSWASEISGISVSPTTASISGTSTTQLVATTTPAGGTVTWESSNTAVATVSSSGLVTGVGNGQATITARCGRYNATCAVTVSGFATLTGITAVYSGGAVGDNININDLKTDLVVTATYSDSHTETVTDYTLSGTLAEGTSIITVSYSGQTTTFTVSVTHVIDYTQPGTYTFADDKWANKGITDDFTVNGGTLESRFSVDSTKRLTHMELIPVSSNGVNITFNANTYKLVPVTFKADKTYKYVNSLEKYFTTSPISVSASSISSNGVAYITFHVGRKSESDISSNDVSDINITLEVS